MSSYEQKRQEQEDYYNQTAQNYDKWHIEPRSSKIVDEWNFKNLEEFVGRDGATVVLDLACGTGRLLKRLEKISTELYGVDQSEEVLKIAKEKNPDVIFSKAEATHLPYEDNFFDLVVVNGSLHHLFAIDEVLKEVHRVLKPNGKFAILGEPNDRYYKWFNPFFYVWIFTRIMSKIFVWPKKVNSHDIEPDAEDFNPEILEDKLINSGFTIRDYYSYDYFPRNDWIVYIWIYKYYLNIERKVISKILPKWGMALQAFLTKNE